MAERCGEEEEKICTDGECEDRGLYGHANPNTDHTQKVKIETLNPLSHKQFQCSLLKLSQRIQGCADELKTYNFMRKKI